MSTHVHDLGDLVRVYTETPFTDAESGDHIDPDAVNVSVRDPEGEVTTYVYGTDDEVVRNGTGDYEMNIDANAAGVWYYRFWSTGDGQAAEERRFEVKAARAVEEA